MAIATSLLKAQYVGVRELREHLSERFRRRQPIIVTEHGTPTKVILSYEDALELLDILDELQDRETLETIRLGRRAVERRVKGRPVSRLFDRIRLRK